MLNRIIPLPVAALLISAVFTQSLSALEADRQQPIEIQADRAELDEKQGQAHYQGNVVLTQGSLTIRSDSLVIKATPEGQIQQVTAVGKPAEFTQTPEQGKPPVVAKATTIDYFVAEEKMDLIENATVVQNDNFFQGSKIQYDIRNQRMQATSNGVKGHGDRVKMILPPSSTAGETPSGDAPSGYAPKGGSKP